MALLAAYLIKVSDFMVIRESPERVLLNKDRFSIYYMSPYFSELCTQLIRACQGQDLAPSKWEEIPQEVLEIFANSSNAIEFLMLPESSSILS